MTPFLSHNSHAVLQVGVFSLMPSITQLSDRMVVLKEEGNFVIRRILAITASHIWVSDKLC